MVPTLREYFDKVQAPGSVIEMIPKRASYGLNGVASRPLEEKVHQVGPPSSPLRQPMGVYA